MAATRRQHKNQKESAWVPPLQRDPGPWNRLLLNWLATLAIIMVFGLVMLYSASYTTGYLRMGDSLHYIKQQAICMAIGIGCMVVMSYVAPLPALGEQAAVLGGAGHAGRHADLCTAERLPPLDPSGRPDSANL